MSMNQAKRTFLGDTKVAAPLSKTAPRASNAVGFFRVTKKSPICRLRRADRASGKTVIIGWRRRDQRHTYWNRELLPVH